MIRSPFVYEKNNTKLIVRLRCSFDDFICELLLHSQLRELVLHNKIELTSNNYTIDFNNLPQIQRLEINEIASKHLTIPYWLIHHFAHTLRAIDAHFIQIPQNVTFPQLRYMRTSKLTIFDVVHYPKLTHFHMIHSLPVTFPYIVVEQPIIIVGNSINDNYNLFYLNILRNQKREKAALVVYWYIKKLLLLGKDVANLLVNYVMCIPNTFWKLSECDIPETKQEEDRIYFPYFTRTLKKLERDNRNMLNHMDSVRNMYSNIAKLELELIQQKKKQNEHKDKVKTCKESVTLIVENLKRRKTTIIDEGEMRISPGKPLEIFDHESDILLYAKDCKSIQEEIEFLKEKNATNCFVEANPGVEFLHLKKVLPDLKPIMKIGQSWKSYNK